MGPWLWMVLACAGGDADKTDTEPTDETSGDATDDTESATDDTETQDDDTESGSDDTESPTDDTESSTDDTESPTDDTESSTDTESGSDYELTDASWSFTESQDDENGCALSPADYGYLDVDDDSSITVQIYNSTYHYMILQADDLSIGFVCTYSSASFACNEQEVDYDLDGYEGTRTFTYDLEGSWPSSSELEVTYTVGVSCSGAGCGDLADDLGISYPCTYAASATLEPTSAR